MKVGWGRIGNTVYSYRKAIVGFTRVARRAGIYEPASPTSAISVATAVKVHGSAGETPDASRDQAETITCYDVSRA